MSAAASDQFKVPDDYDERVKDETKEVMEARANYKRVVVMSHCRIKDMEKLLHETVKQCQLDVAAAQAAVDEARDDLIKSIEDDKVVS